MEPRPVREPKPAPRTFRESPGEHRRPSWGRRQLDREGGNPVERRHDIPIGRPQTPPFLPQGLPVLPNVLREAHAIPRILARGEGTGTIEKLVAHRPSLRSTEGALS
eukprot:6729707-Pyramimonas_sp.AAC.1